MSWNLICNSEQADLKFTFYDSIHLVPQEAWDAVVNGENIYLSIAYLKAMEESLDGEIQFRYAIFYCPQHKPVAVASTQVVNFTSGKFQNQFPKMKSGGVHSKLLNKMKLKVLVCGNMFVTGENGFHHIPELPKDIAFKNLTVALYKLRRSENFADSPISLVLIKELWPETLPHAEQLKENGYKEFNIDVNMVLKMHPGWTSFDEYMDSMVSKFRTKAKSVIKKSAGLTQRVFNLEDVEQYKDEMYRLYSNVTEKADFNFASLNPDAFIGLKRALEDQFVVVGYFEEDQLIGFRSAFVWQGIMDANYVGLDYDKNAEHAVYQRMLYDLVKDCIDSGAGELRLGRTAEQIKSCLGAEPIHMELYLKHKNTLSNKLLRPLVDSISPSEFELRMPFKAEFKPA